MTQAEFQNRYAYNPATDLLGEGGFGIVYKAYDDILNQWVALKISKVNPQYKDIRLREEVEKVAKLPVHKNIAYYKKDECYTFQQMDGEYDIAVLQYYEEGNLSQLLYNNRLMPAQKQAILKQILEGIRFLHENGIIHRDLKPQNILMTKRGAEFIPKITDFGISKKLDFNKSTFFSNSLAGAGTMSYSSPEQLSGGKIGKNTDLWGFGVIAFEMLTGNLPFNTGRHSRTSEAGRQEMYRQINCGELPKEINPISEPWQTLIRRCLIPDAEKRMKSAKETLEVLGSGFGGGKDLLRNDENTMKEKAAAPLKQKAEKEIVPQRQRIETVKEKQKRDEKKNKILTWILGAVAVVFMMFFLIFVFSENDNSPQQDAVMIPQNNTTEHNTTDPGGSSSTTLVNSKPTTSGSASTQRNEEPKPTISQNATNNFLENETTANLVEMGDRYFYGRGVQRNCHEAEIRYRIAAERGDPCAQNTLGTMYGIYDQRYCHIRTDYPEAVKWFRLSAAQGNAEAQFNLGLMYQNGYGTPRNMEEAVKCYLLSAKQGNAAAKYAVNQWNTTGRITQNWEGSGYFYCE